MLARSTGLGKSMLVAKIKDLKPDGDLLILHLETEKPEGWHLRSAMQIDDIPSLMRGFCKPSIILFMIRALIAPKRDPKEPQEF